jgi:hypothetical protein
MARRDILKLWCVSSRQRQPVATTHRMNRREHMDMFGQRFAEFRKYKGKSRVFVVRNCTCFLRFEKLGVLCHTDTIFHHFLGVSDLPTASIIQFKVQRVEMCNPVRTLPAQRRSTGTRYSYTRTVPLVQFQSKMRRAYTLSLPSIPSSHNSQRS